jgi:hypothetical protein
MPDKSLNPPEAVHFQPVQQNIGWAQPLRAKMFSG